MKQATLCIPIQEGKILLGMKKRGFGEGKLNGFGGKINENETVEQAAIRELYEEVELKTTQKDIKKMGELNFVFPNKTEWNQIVHVFLINNWKNFPKESEEMTFEWIDINKIPFERMWDDDKYWLPLVLAGKRIKADFYFDADNSTIKDKKILDLK